MSLNAKSWIQTLALRQHLADAVGRKVQQNAELLDVRTHQPWPDTSRCSSALKMFNALNKPVVEFCYGNAKPREPSALRIGDFSPTMLWVI